MDLNKIEQKGSWGGQAASLNHNFSRIDAEMVKLASATGKLCGYFTDVDSLSALHPAPVVGMLAYIGKTSPYAVYICKVAGKWESTGESFIPIVSVPDIVQKDGDSKTSVMSQAAVAKIISQYDVSASNGGAKYALREAIDAVPLHFQKGGLSIKFVNQSTNEYVTFYNTSDKWTTDFAKWKSVSGEVDLTTKSEIKKSVEELLPGGVIENAKIDNQGFIRTGNAAYGSIESFAVSEGDRIHIYGSSSGFNKAAYALFNGETKISVGDAYTGNSSVTVDKTITIPISVDNIKVSHNVGKKTMLVSKKRTVKTELGELLNISEITSAKTISNNHDFDKAVKSLHLPMSKEELSKYRFAKVYDRYLVDTIKVYTDENDKIFLSESIKHDDETVEGKDGSIYDKSKLIKVQKVEMLKGHLMSDISTTVYVVKGYVELPTTVKYNSEGDYYFDGFDVRFKSKNLVFFDVDNNRYWYIAGQKLFDSPEVYQDAYQNYYTDSSQLITSKTGEVYVKNGRTVALTAKDLNVYLSGISLGETADNMTKIFLISEKAFDRDDLLKRASVKGLNFDIEINRSVFQEIAKDGCASFQCTLSSNICTEEKKKATPKGIAKYGVDIITPNDFSKILCGGEINEDGKLIVSERLTDRYSDYFEVIGLSMAVAKGSNGRISFYSDRKKEAFISSHNFSSSYKVINVPYNAKYARISFVYNSIQTVLKYLIVEGYDKASVVDNLDYFIKQNGTNSFHYLINNDKFKELRWESSSNSKVITLFSSNNPEDSNIISSIDAYADYVSNFVGSIKTYSSLITDECKLIKLDFLNKYGGTPKVKLSRNVTSQVASLREHFHNDEGYLKRTGSTPKFINAFLLDIFRKYYTIDNIKKLIDACAAAGLNYMFVHFSGTQAFRLKLNDMNITTFNGSKYDLSRAVGLGLQKVGNVSDGDLSYYTEDDMNIIIEYARDKNIEIIPSFNCLTHIGCILHQFKQFRKTKEDLDVASFEAQEFGLAIVDKYASYFASKGCHYYNLCADEPLYKVTKDNIKDIADYVNAAAHVVISHDLEPMMFNDMVGQMGEKPYINRGIRVLYWTTSGDSKSISDLENFGYRLINCTGEIYWRIARTSNIESVKNFDFKFFRKGMPFKEALGSVLCSWSNSANIDGLDGGDAAARDVIPFIEEYGKRLKSPYQIGEFRFDTATGRPAWWNGTAWVNANGEQM